MRCPGLLAGALTVIGLCACGGSEEPEAVGGTSPSYENPAFNPAGKIAFTGEGTGTESDRFFDIYLINPDGSGRLNLTRTPAVHEDSPAWSPDGRRIVFARSENRRTEDIWVMNADGGEQVRLTDTPQLHDDRPAWSPDGQRIAFQRSSLGPPPEGVSDIYVVDAGGGDVTRLTTTAYVAEGNPAWSPDGERMLFLGTFVAKLAKRDPPVGIFAMNVDGSDERLLTRGAALDEVIPHGASFSPDGKRIAFAGLREGARDPVIWLMNADGSNAAPLPGATSGFSTPSFSPVGQWIAFEAYPPPGISVIAVDGSEEFPLTENVPNDREPAWSPVPAGSRR
jgi:TolB protein